MDLRLFGCFLLTFIFTGSCVTSSQIRLPRLFSPVEKARSHTDFRDLSNKGMVVAAHPIAAEAGAAMLEKGGNAADAAVAASFAISVVRPQSTGIGGGGFLLYYDRSEKDTHVLDFRERAPKAATRNMFVGSPKGALRKVTYKGKVVPSPSMNGHLSVAIPGLVRGLVEFHKKFGSLKLSDVMAPAIRAATLGFPVYPTLASALDERKDILGLYESSRKIFFKEGRPLRQGETLIQKDLAETLTEISEQGDAVFYQGSIAEKIVAEMKDGGGIVSAGDLAGYATRQRTVLKSVYRGQSVLAMPPPSSGGVHLIEMLNMLEGDNLKALGHGSVAYNHLLAEVMRRAFADRAVYLGDPDFVKVPVDTLVSKAHAKKLRASIRKDRASSSAELHNPVISTNESSSTTHISVVDRSGNAVSTTQTINYLFGSCVVAEGTGIVLNDEMDDFASAPGTPNAFGLIQGESNAIAPGKTPLSSMTPTILVDSSGDVQMVVGSPGGPKIINAVLQTILNVTDFDMPLLDAVHAYRIHHQWLPDQIRFEKGGLQPAEHTGLTQLGHVLMPTETVGDVSAIIKRTDGGWEGVADVRSEGRAVGQE